MGAHTFIVSTDTFPLCRDSGFVAIPKEEREKPLWEKTQADILADISCLRVGDSVFFYEIQVGFHGIYEVHSLPFVDNTDEIYPYKALIRPKYYLPIPLKESRAFGLKNSATDLRSIFYKKVLGRGKANTHLFPEEEKLLTELLFKANNGVKELIINPYQAKQSQRIFFNIEPNEQGEVRYEKILEGWIVQNIDDLKANTSVFLGDIQDIECFANYVPINIAGGNIDILVYHKKKIQNKEIRYKISIIELKKGDINIDAVKELETYIKWAYENISNGDMEIIQPILIGKRIRNEAIERCKHYSINERKPLLIEYNIDTANKWIHFLQKQY